MILAHYQVNEDGSVNEQFLEEHLLNCGNIAFEIGKIIKLGSFMRIIAYLHDLGKADSRFQQYVRGEERKQVNHSSAGAKYFTDIFESFGETNGWTYKSWFRCLIEVGQYAILAHHGLFDVITYDSSYRVKQRLEYDVLGSYNYNKDVVSFAESFNMHLISSGLLSFEELVAMAAKEFESVFLTIVELAKAVPDPHLYKVNARDSYPFYLSCLTRLILSILKEADIYDSSSCFLSQPLFRCDSESLESFWSEKFRNIEELYSTYLSHPNLSELNKVRNNLANQAMSFALEHNEGIFKLDLPTGAGKTMASTRYGLANVTTFKKSRFVYVTAFLSVLEQNASEIKSAIGPEGVLEHHSNVVVEKEQHIHEQYSDNSDYSPVSYLIESWESPIILTTMVQFSNTLFGGRAANLRRFCKLIDSTIVIDEIQSLPLKALYSFNLMFNFLKYIMKCNVVHSTATQPAFDAPELKFPVLYGDRKQADHSICRGSVEALTCFDRVDFFNLTGKNANEKMNTEDVVSSVMKTMKTFNSCLVVVNTKRAVLELYEAVKSSLYDGKVYCLTTNLCPAHRLEKIREIKKMLVDNRRNANSNNRVVCISTQLIEAGVDLDFDVVYRSLAGMDSLIQSAGRCNREGKLKLNGKLCRGKVYIFRYTVENLSRLSSIQETIDASSEALRALQTHEAQTPINMNILQEYYFRKYYVENMDKMMYPLRGGRTIVDMLGPNLRQRNEYEIKHYPQKYNYILSQSFDSSAKEFNLIDEDTVGLIVQYNNDKLIRALYTAIDCRDYQEISSILRQLQPYTVNLYRNQVQNGFIRKEMEGSILLLEEECYSEEVGVSMDKLPDYIF